MGVCTNNGVEIPEPIIEECGGSYRSDVCILHPEALVELGLSTDSSVNLIIQTMYTAIVSMQQRLTDLESV